MRFQRSRRNLFQNDTIVYKSQLVRLWSIPSLWMSDSSFSDSDIAAFMSPIATDDNAANGAGVGLSNPELSHGRRQMLDLVNRLHSTGQVWFPVTPVNSSPFFAP
jgi:hypothetical protein